VYLNSSCNKVAKERLTQISRMCCSWDKRIQRSNFRWKYSF